VPIAVISVRRDMRSPLSHETELLNLTPETLADVLANPASPPQSTEPAEVWVAVVMLNGTQAEVLLPGALTHSEAVDEAWRRVAVSVRRFQVRA
jgi:hypothetical protein